MVIHGFDASRMVTIDGVQKTQEEWWKIGATPPPMGRIKSNVPAETTITTAGTFYKVAGTTTLGMGYLFDMPADNRLRYIGTQTRHFHVVAQGNLVFAAGSNLIGALQVSYHDASAETTTLIDPIARGTTPGNGGVLQLTSHTDLPMDENDYLELWLTNESSTSNGTLSNIYLFLLGMLPAPM